MTTGTQAARMQPHRGRGRGGMTMIEVAIAMAVVALICGGLYAVGLKSGQFAEHNRLATEARTLAKERLEEMIALGADNLAQPTCTLLNADTNFGVLGYDIVRRPRIAWHAANGSASAATNAAYAEVHVDVVYRSPLLSTNKTDSYSMLLECE